MRPVRPKDLPAKAVLVLGMHRSGTSALARTINLLGAELSADMLKPDAANPSGYWESESLMALHDRLLEEAGSAWDDWKPLDLSRIRPARFDELHADAVAWTRENFKHSRLFVIKDPRICRLVPFWMAVLKDCGVSLAAVIPIRNPLEVAASLKSRDACPEQKSYMVWLRHVIEAERATRGSPRTFTSYEDLVSRPNFVADVVFDLLKLKDKPSAAPDGIDRFLNPGLRHHMVDKDELDRSSNVPGWVKETYAIMTAFISDGPTRDGECRLDEIRDAFDSACSTSIARRVLDYIRPQSEIRRLLVELHRQQVVEFKKRDRKSRKRARVSSKSRTA